MDNMNESELVDFMGKMLFDQDAGLQVCILIRMLEYRDLSMKNVFT